MERRRNRAGRARHHNERASTDWLDRQTLPWDVETIVAKSLEKDKARRYVSAAGLASDVRRHLRDEPISARPASAGYQLRKLARRHRAMFVGLSVAVVALVVGAAVSVVMAVRARAAERLAESRRGEAVASQSLAEQSRGEAEAGRIAADAARLAADSARKEAVYERTAAISSSNRAESEAARAVAVSRFLEDMIGSANPDLTQGRTLTIKDVVDRAGRNLDSGRLTGQPAVRADLHLTLARMYVAVAAYDSAIAHFDSAQALRQRTLGPTNAATIVTMLEGANARHESRDLAGSERQYRASLEAARRVQPPRPDLIVQATRRLAMAAQLGQREAEADSLASAALALARQARVSDSLINEAVQSLAEVRTFAGRTKDAEPLWREVVDYNRRRYGERNTFTLSTIYGLAYNLSQQGRYAESEALLRPALPVMRAVYGDHTLVANVLDRLGTAIVRQGRREEAEPLLRESLAMRLKVLGERHSDVQLVRTSLGRLTMGDGRFAESESLFTAALRARAAVLGARHGAVASSMEDLASLAMIRGDLPEAARRYREVIPIWHDVQLVQFEHAAASKLAEVLTLQGELDEAERLLVEVLPKQWTNLGETNNLVAATVYRLAEVARHRGRLAEADSIHREALAMRRRIYGPTSINLDASLTALATVREQMGDTASAEPILRELVEITRAVRPPNDPTLLERKVRLGTVLCATGKVAEGEQLAREAVVTLPAGDTIRVTQARRTVDACLTRASR